MRAEDAVPGAAFAHAVYLGDLPAPLVAVATVGTAGAAYLGVTAVLGMPLRSMVGAGARRR